MEKTVDLTLYFAIFSLTPRSNYPALLKFKAERQHEGKALVVPFVIDNELVIELLIEGIINLDIEKVPQKRWIDCRTFFCWICCEGF